MYNLRFERVEAVYSGRRKPVGGIVVVYYYPAESSYFVLSPDVKYIYIYMCMLSMSSILGKTLIGRTSLQLVWNKIMLIGFFCSRSGAFLLKGV